MKSIWRQYIDRYVPFYIAVFLVRTPFSLVDGYQRFGGKYCINIQVNIMNPPPYENLNNSIQFGLNGRAFDMFPRGSCFVFRLEIH
jgi:hypothetical protein